MVDSVVLLAVGGHPTRYLHPSLVRLWLRLLLQDYCAVKISSEVVWPECLDMAPVSLAVIRRLLPPLHNAAVSTSGGEKRRRPQSNGDGGHAEVVFVGRPEYPGLGSMDGMRWTG